MHVTSLLFIYKLLAVGVVSCYHNFLFYSLAVAWYHLVNYAIGPSTLRYNTYMVCLETGPSVVKIAQIVGCTNPTFDWKIADVRLLLKALHAHTLSLASSPDSHIMRLVFSYIM